LRLLHAQFRRGDSERDDGEPRSGSVTTPASVIHSAELRVSADRLRRLVCESNPASVYSALTRASQLRRRRVSPAARRFLFGIARLFGALKRRRRRALPALTHELTQMRPRTQVSCCREVRVVSDRRR
jgi:hypothetical protein